MKKLFLLALTLSVVCGCQRFNIGPKGEGEYVIGSATVEYKANAISAMKKEAFRKAQYDSLERAVRVFLSSSTLMEYPEAVKKDILGKQDNYIIKHLISFHSTNSKNLGCKYKDLNYNNL
jgi:hypothetical protein